MNTAAIPRYTITNDSITVIKDGKSSTILKGKPSFEPLKAALFRCDWDIDRYLNPGDAIARWANGRFTVKAGVVYFDSEPMPDELNSRLIAMADEGSDPTPLMRFWERLQNNPSSRSVNQLWRFLQHAGIPLTSDGHFLAYKGVRTDFLDQHSGKISNKPGEVVSLPRNKISDDPVQTCHFGLHVGALEYAAGFAPTVMICKVDPADVVCVPNDYSSQKMRVCRYVVVGLHNGDGLMPSTSIPDEDVPDENNGWMDSDDELEEEGFEWTVDDPYVMDGKAEVVHDEGPEPDAAPVTPKTIRKPCKRWKRFDDANVATLWSFSTDELRTYASQRLRIVGASRISGGKAALIGRIMEVR